MLQSSERGAGPQQTWLDRLVNGKRRVVPGVHRHLIAPTDARERVHYRCWIHHTHAAEHRCDKCGRMFCDACLSESSWGNVCEVCNAEIQRKVELDRQWLRRVLFSRNWIPIGLVMAASILVAGQLYVATNGIDLRRDLAVKMRLFFEGSNPENGVVLSATVVGGQAAAAGGSATGFGAGNLIDGVNEPDLAGWRSAGPQLPQDLVLRMNLRGPIARVDIYNHPLEPTATWPRHLQVLVSDDDPRKDASTLTLVQDSTLEATPTQFVQIPPTVGRWVVLRLLDNYGSTSYTSVGEVEVRGPKKTNTTETRTLDAAVPHFEP